MLKPRARKVKILATLGPASSSPEMIRALMEAGADAFRINMSHGSQAEKAKLVEAIRALEKELHRPTTILFDLQGPKLRVGKFKGGSAMLEHGQMFVFDREQGAGRRDPGRAAASRTVRGGGEGHPAADRRRQGAAARRRGREGPDRRGGRGRRQGQQQQGRQRPRRAGADPGADREGPRATSPSRSSRAPIGSPCRSSSGPRTSPRRASWSATRRRCWPRSRSRRRSSGSTRYWSWPTR